MRKIKIKIVFILLLGFSVFGLIYLPSLITKAIPTTLEQECENATKKYSSAQKKDLVAICKKYVKNDLTIIDAAMEYHKQVNDIFNGRIEKLLALKGNYSLSYDNVDCNIDSYNLEPACLAKLVLVEYNGYDLALSIREKYFNELEECFTDKNAGKEKNEWGFEVLTFSLSENDNKIASYQSKANQASFKARLISEERKFDKKTLDTALAAYGELYWSYPLHLEFEKMIKELKNYNDKFGSLRSEVEQFEGKFVDASSTDCT